MPPSPLFQRGEIQGVFVQTLNSAHPRISIYQSMTFGEALSRVRSEMIDFGPRQGRTRVFAAGVAGLRRGRKPAELAGMVISRAGCPSGIRNADRQGE